uniref:YqaJ viral recombinase family nuclease n=1 Tax=Pseudonocardia sp. CA-138482 TaxID=3240023 RepID=UPI003F4963AF
MAPNLGADHKESTPSEVGTGFAQPAHVSPYRELLPPDAPRAEWLAARRLGIGGSDSSTLLGFNPYSSLLELWLDKTGRSPIEIDNDAMEWGRRLEPAIREYFTDVTGIAVRRAGLLQSTAHPLALVTPDGLTSDGAGLEIKTLSWRKADEWSDEQIADHAEIQAQHAMAVTGLPYWWVVALIDGRRPLVRRVEPDPVIKAEILEAVAWFWNSYVVPDEPPPLHGGEPENAAMRQFYPAEEPGKVTIATPELIELLGQWQDAKRAEKAAEANTTAIDTRIRGLIGDAEAVVMSGEDPKLIATLRANGTFSEKRFRAAEPALADEFTVAKATQVLDLAAFKKAKPDLAIRFRSRVLRVTSTFTQLQKGA